MTTTTEMHIQNRHPDCACVACTLAGLVPQPGWLAAPKADAIVVSAWMLMTGDVVNGKTVKFTPVYTTPAKTHVRIDFTDGTDEILERRADVTVG